MTKHKEKPEHVAAALRAITESRDAEQLQRIMFNAKSKGATEVYDAAFAKRLCLLPGEAPGTVAHDLWKSIYALEQIRSEEAGKTIRLSRTRQSFNELGS